MDIMKNAKTLKKDIFGIIKDRTAATTSHPIRRQQIKLAIIELKWIYLLWYWVCKLMVVQADSNETLMLVSLISRANQVFFTK